MKTKQLIIAILATSSFLVSCKDDAPSPSSTTEQNSVIALDAETLYTSLEKTLTTDEQKVFFRAGFNGDETKAAEVQQNKELMTIYYSGATIGGQTQLAKRGLENGFSPTHGLIMASIANRVDIAKLMLEKGAIADIELMTPETEQMKIYPAQDIRLISLAAAYGNKEIVELLLENGTDIEDALYGAAYGGHIELIQLLINKGAHISCALEGASFSGRKDIVTYLMDKGEGLKYGLLAAARAGHMDIVNMYLEKGVNPCYGLEGAAIGGHLEIAQLMLDKGANLYNDALRYAAYCGHIDIVKLLLAKGDNPKKAISAAKEGGHPEIVELLKNAGAKE